MQKLTKMFMMTVVQVAFSLFFTATGHAISEWEVFGPKTIVRRTGASTTETFTFSALGGQAILKLTNGSIVDPSVEKVSGSEVTFNGQVVFGSADFNQIANHVESEIPLIEGQNTLEVLLKGKPGGQLIIQIIQEISDITPEIVRVRTANCLRTGDIEGALEGFAPNERAKFIPSLNDAQRNDLSNCLENAEFVIETSALRWYRYTWKDESGENFIKFSMTRDKQGRWIITSW